MTENPNNDPFGPDRYIAYSRDTVVIPAQNVAAIVTRGIGADYLQTDGFEQVQTVAENAYNAAIRWSVDHAEARNLPIIDHMNAAFNGAHEAVSEMARKLDSMERLLNSVQETVESNKLALETMQDLNKEYKKQLDQIPAGAGQGVGGRLKVADPPTFSGSDNHANVEDWLNQVVLYCSATGNVTDQQKIVCALTRIRAPAQKYVKSYFDKNRKGEDLGTWNQFVNELTQLYGQRDDKEGAKKEITALWNNKNLAQKDFIKYAEQYRTLARLVEYEDAIHIDKIRNVLPQDVRTTLVTVEIVHPAPNDWDKYLEQAISIYKKLNPDKGIGAIFSGNKGNHSSSGKSTAKDPDAMEIDTAKQTKGKSTETSNEQPKKKFCQICAGKDLKNKAKTHNTNDCWDKPGNEGKRPTKSSVQSKSTSTVSTSGSNQGSNKNKLRQSPRKFASKKQWKAAIAELMDEMPSDDEDTDGNNNINTLHASIEEVEDSMDIETVSTAQVARAQQGQSKKTTRAISDFLEEL